MLNVLPEEMQAIHDREKVMLEGDGTVQLDKNINSKPVSTVGK